MALAPSPSAKSSSTMLNDGEKTFGTNGHISANGSPQTPPFKSEVDVEPSDGTDARAGDIEEARENKPAPTPGIGGFGSSPSPDGGFEAWLVVAGGWAVLFCSFGWINCIGVFQNYYQQHQLSQYSPSVVSWIPSLEVFIMFFGGPVVGKCFDNFGPRYLLLIGTLLHVFGLMMTSLSSEYYQFLLAQGVVSAAGACAIFYAAMSSVSTWFMKNRAFSFGIMASGSSLGGVILPIMVEHLIPKVGFGWTMRITAFMMLGMLVFANFTVKSRLPPAPKPLNLLDFITPFKEIPFLFVTFGSVAFVFGMFLPINYLIVQALHQGMSVNLGAYLIPILNAASIFGRILPGWIGDRIGRFNVMVLMTFFSGLIVLVLWLPSIGNAPIIVFAALFGFGSGAYVSLIPAIIAQISDIREIGVRNGALFAVASIGALCGNPIGGALITTNHGGFRELQIFSGGMMLTGATFYTLARTSLVGLALVKKV